ncbi:20af5215-9e69-4f21-9ff8-23ef1893d835 [Sclerotinia trifoliorum]|uniref:20af5215-9e69-4f21-9ff8-23ef1893d835 n=1 Tax=Sclerotinia trifoliorum TaxID=28548 RepID=A0A8H2VUX8_9HELO|nr:20af5215-9e69-4f21-9ff8-23ef1893d835 [Sclerotinia trifoliorum]
MSRPPPFYPVIPINMAQHNYQQQVDPGNPIVAGQTSQAPQSTANDPTRWQVQNHASAPAWISTLGGRFPKREPVANVRATRILHSNIKADINVKAASLRQLYPGLIRYVKKPTGWDDLYHLWDAADIQMESPEFLYYVMHQLGEENEQLDRECELAKHHEIDEYVQAWVTNKRELVLSCAAGGMYELFCSDPSEDDDFSPELKLILNKTLEVHRLRLLRDASGNAVNATVHNSLQPNSVPQMVRSVSDNRNRPEQDQIVGPTISIVTGSQSITAQPGDVKTESHFLPLTQAQSTPSFHGGRDLSMPLNLQIQNQPASTKQEENMGLTSVVPHQPQTHNHVIEAQRGIVKAFNALTDINLAAGLDLATGLNASSAPSVSPARHNSYRNDNTFRNRPRPREDSIGTHRNRRNQWMSPHGTHQNKFIHQTPHNRQQSTSGSMRGSPSRVLQVEPIYIRNLEHSSSLVSDIPNQRMGNGDFVGSHTELPSDVQMTFPHSKINQHLDLGEMEGDPKLFKTDTFCVYTYDISAPRNSFGRTLYLKGPDLKMFHTNHLKNLMSTVGNVVSIKYLFKSYDNGPVFVTFDADVLAMAIEKFNGYRLPDGRLLTAGYPHENSRDRSGSNSSYNSYHGDNHNRYVSAAGSDNRAYSRRNSISQHRPSRSQSGQIPFRYFSGNHMISGNVSEPLSHLNSPTRPYPAPYVPVAQQQSPGHALGAVISEVVQHERGIAHLQQQMPLAIMNSRTNVAGGSHHRTFGGAQAESHHVNTNSGEGPALPNPSNLPGNRKENSPIKQVFDENTQFTPTREHRKASKFTQITYNSTTPVTTPAATPAKPLSQTQLKNPTVEVVSLEAFTNEVATTPKTSQLSTNEITAEPESLSTEIIKEIAAAAPESPGHVEKFSSNLSSEQVATEAAEQLSLAKTKNSKKNKKQFKSNSKVDIDEENNIVRSTRAIPSPAESESTNPSLVGGDILFSGDSTRKPSVSSMDSISNNFLTKIISKSQIISDKAENTDEKERTSGKALDNELILAASVALTLSNGTTANSSHQRLKTDGSTNDSLDKSRSVSVKDLKKQPHSNNSDNCDSPKTATGPVIKTELKKAKFHGKNPQDGGARSSEQQEQPKTDSNNKKKRDLPEASQEMKRSSVLVVSNDSSEWPSLAPSKSPPSSIANGKPPKSIALPASTILKTKEVIKPALPLKPIKPLHRPS